jgi:hypothetical protein
MVPYNDKLTVLIPSPDAALDHLQPIRLLAGGWEQPALALLSSLPLGQGWAR